jgi:histidyl-tRNA synthetase
MTKSQKFQTPTGMHDILPEDQKYFQKIYEVVEEITDFYGFHKIDTPILEDAELFARGVGLSSEIVAKQMYTLKSKGDDILTLRPEGTAPIVRSYLEHGMQNLPQPVKLWYFGPFFRYERPQFGRYRQFWQFGLEVLGDTSPVLDAQIIQIFSNIFKELKLKDLSVEVNSIGDSQCRPYYKKLLVNYLKSREVALCGDCRRRLRENPLRILDCKEEKCQPIKTQAPQMLDHLCEICHAHFKEVLEFLEELGLTYRLNPYLVRGLDYYTKTVFEIFDESEKEKTLGALAGGGRYDALAKMIGGRDVPGVGGAAGIERIIESLKTKSIRYPKEFSSKVFLAQLGVLAKRKSLKLLEQFREAGIPVTESFGRDSLKAQLKLADKNAAKYTLILGQKEALDGTVIIRDMENGKQETVKFDKVVREMEKYLKK